VTTTAPTAAGVTSNDGLPPIQSAKNDAALQAAFTNLDCSKTGATKGGAADPAKFLVTCSTDGQLKYLLEPAAVQGNAIPG
jgi:preprotein translocase subunit SecD